MLDAGAFYAGITFQSASTTLYTTPSVLKEVEHIKSGFSALDALKDSGRLIVMEPDPQFQKTANQASLKAGEKRKLSAADLSVISLALQLKCLLVSDDFAVTNVASLLGLRVRPATAGKGIKEMRRWISYCSGCSRTFDASQIECKFCGNKLRRKYRKIHSDP